MFNRNNAYIKSVSEKKMDLGKLLLASSLAIPLSYSVALGDEFGQEARLGPKESDRLTGVYVDFVESFTLGYGADWDEKRIKGVLGKEKYSVKKSLSLGDKGEVIISYTGGVEKKNSAFCFRRNEFGPSLYVHEANNKDNIIEKVEVFVTPDKILDKSTRWVSLGTKSISQGRNNWIAFNMPEVIEEAYHVKLKDVGEGLTTDTESYAGFDASAVLLTKPCVPTS